MVGIYLLFVAVGSLAVLGFFVLTCTPSLRLTIANLILFVVGGFAGMLALSNLFIWGMRHILVVFRIQVTQGSDSILILPALLGAALGGATLVWLKMRFTNVSKRKPPNIGSDHLSEK